MAGRTRHHCHLAGQVGELLAVHPIALVEHDAAPVALAQRPGQEGVARESAVEADEQELGDLALARQRVRDPQERCSQRTGRVPPRRGLAPPASASRPAGTRTRDSCAPPPALAASRTAVAPATATTAAITSPATVRRLRDGRHRMPLTRPGTTTPDAGSERGAADVWAVADRRGSPLVRLERAT